MSSSSIAQSTPVLVGGGQGVWRKPPPDLEDGRAPHPLDLCADVAQRALDDARASNALAGSIDSVVLMRMFEDCNPSLAHTFGRSNKPPRSLAQRIGANPEEAVYAAAGGETPQRTVNELSERIARGELECALIAGVENVATIKAAKRLGATLSFSETVEGQSTDQGFGTPWFDEHQLRHRVAAPIHCYPLLEHAIRRSRENDVPHHLRSMALLFAPFSEVAAANPNAYHREVYSVAQLSDPAGINRTIADPYGRLLNARDTVDMASAVLLMSYSKARSLGIATDRLVFLHGCADASERPLMLDRPALERSGAARAMAKTAFEMAGIGSDELGSLDLYSCFPASVEIVAQEMGIAEDDPRGLTTTGGLPYFGGPGNNYSLHAIVEAISLAREAPKTYHWVSANGGNVNKHSAGIYSAQPVTGEWRRPTASTAQDLVDAEPKPLVTREPEGRATVETYTVAYDRESAPLFGIVVGRTLHAQRFLSVVSEADPSTLAALIEEGHETTGSVTTENGLSSFRTN